MTQAIIAPIARKDNGNTLLVDGANGGVVSGGFVVQHLRANVTIAQVNAGLTLLPALDAHKAYRLVDAYIIAVGGAAAGATSVDILATLASASRKLVAHAIAGLTQDAVLRAGAANAAVLAGGASFQVNDGGTAITIGKTGANVITAVSFEVHLSYVIDEV